MISNTPPPKLRIHFPGGESADCDLIAEWPPQAPPQGPRPAPPLDAPPPLPPPQQAAALRIARALTPPTDNLVVARTQDGRCVKLRTPVAAAERELAGLRAFAASGLTPPVHALFETTRADGRRWAGACMDLVSDTVGQLLFPAEGTQAARARAVEALYLQQSSPKKASNHNNNNVPMGADSLGTALIAACLTVLQSVHERGWVHGDTHLGNFLLDVATWRVYIIDFERAFECDLPEQQLMDLQELIGHASGLLLNFPQHNAWDMCDLRGVTAELHPFLPLSKTKSIVHAFLPVCACFANEDREERLRGCAYCKSHAHRRTAARYRRHCPHLALAMLRHTLPALQRSVAESRVALRRRTAPIVDRLARKSPETRAAWTAELYQLIYAAVFVPSLAREAQARARVLCASSPTLAKLLLPPAPKEDDGAVGAPQQKKRRCAVL